MMKYKQGITINQLYSRTYQFIRYNKQKHNFHVDKHWGTPPENEVMCYQCRRTETQCVPTTVDP